MNLNEITIRKDNSIHIGSTKNGRSKKYVATALTEIMQLGYVFDEKLIQALSATSATHVKSKLTSIINTLKKLKGADVDYTPMYPNFPKQVMEASDIELFFNAVIHYLTGGEVSPEYEKEMREIVPENVELTVLTLADDNVFSKIGQRLLGSKDSLSGIDRNIAATLVQRELVNPADVDIPFKENLCTVADIIVKNTGGRLSDVLKTSTDVLRYCVHLSGGDVDLSTKPKFKSFKRSQRKLILEALEQCISAEDVKRNKQVWINLFHCLHVGDYVKRFPNIYKIANDFRNKNNVATIYTQIEQHIQSRNLNALLPLLSKRAGDFARKMGELFTKFDSSKDQLVILSAFSKVANNVSSKVLLQMFASIRYRTEDRDMRVAFPKGSIAKAILINTKQPKVHQKVIDTLEKIVSNVLTERNTQRESKVLISESMKECPLPASMRNASDALQQCARGTRIPLGDPEKNTVRFFIYWVGRDIDLSASLHDENLNKTRHISYTSLHDDFGCHSGDITYAPNGASEFIDINLDKIDSKERYIMMHVYVYEGGNFSEHEKVYAGWMMRERPDSGEIYEPTTVVNKIDLTQESLTAVPIIIDTVERCVINVDIGFEPNFERGGLNIESNTANHKHVIQSFLNLENKPTIFDAFKLSGFDITQDPEEADIVVDFDGDITPYDVDKINSEII